MAFAICFDNSVNAGVTAFFNDNLLTSIGWVSFHFFNRSPKKIFHAVEICCFPIGSSVKDDENEDENDRAVSD